MIRFSKPVKLMEWGEGTNTLNQVWTEVGEGRIDSSTQKSGLTTLIIRMTNSLAKKNSKDNSIKLVQPGEGMTARSDHWGEVATGHLKSVEAGGQVVQIEISTATKIDKRRSLREQDHN